MVQIDSPSAAKGEGGRYTLSPGTLAAVVLAVCLAQMALSVPSLITGLIQQDLAPSSAQLTWIVDAFMLPVAALELSSSQNAARMIPTVRSRCGSERSARWATASSTRASAPTSGR